MTPGLPGPITAESAGVTLAILAGGQGRRMGAAKDRVHVGGTPILLHLLRQVGHAGPTLLVVAAAHQRPVGVDAFDAVTTDAVEDAGPMAGIAAALAVATTPLTIVLSVDMPNVGAEQVRWLEKQLKADTPVDTGQPADESWGLMLRRQEGSRIWIEPLPAIYRRAAGHVLQERLRTRSAISLRSLADEPGFRIMDAPAQWPVNVWLNLNRQDDLSGIGAELI